MRVVCMLLDLIASHVCSVSELDRNAPHPMRERRRTLQATVRGRGRRGQAELSTRITALATHGRATLS